MKGRQTYSRLLCVLLGATTLALLVGAAPASAAIGTMTANLTISRLAGTGNVCSWQVSGVVQMPQAEAQDLINRGYRVIFRGWGDDPVSDDFLFGPDPASTATSAGALGLSGTTQGLWYRGSRGLSCSKRDEDDSVFDERDELYVGVRLVTGFSNGQYGPTVKSKESNRITGYF
jgi:hypothetical protein